MSMNKEDVIRPAAPALDAVSESGSKGSKSPSELSRGGWGSPVEFVLACLGYAVGLGNVWRFPYLCYRNGGGAFLIPYFLMLVFIGLPLFYLELFVGQYTAVGPIEVFSRIAPAFSGLGYANLVVITLIIIYYMIIVAWTLFYTFMSFNPVLGWGECFNDFNSNNCYSGQYEDQCRNMSFTGAASDMTWWNRTCVTVSSICERENLQPFNGTDCVNSINGTFIKWNTLIERTLASEEYYNGFVLGRQPDTTWENYGAMQWHLVGCLFLSWFVAFLCVIKGVQSAGKVVYFTALFPYVMLTALVIRGVTLEGAVDGILFYIKPDWDQLANAGVWGDAASQIFYSFGVGCGSLITLASYNKFTNNCHFDATFVSITNFLTSIYAGFAIFSVLGFQAQRMGVSVNDVAKDGPGLAFVAYPEAILQMPLPQLWAILFFFMLFILGLGSQFAGIEAVNTAFIDHYPQFRNQKWKVTLATCSICFLLGLPMCFSGGVYLFSLMDWNTASWAILIIGLTECIVVAWCYGANRALDDLRTMSMKLGKVIRSFWWLNWTVLTPVFCVAVFIFIMIEWSPASYEDYVFPPWADALGWMMGLSTLAPIIIGFIYIYFVEKVRGKDLITPTELWGPAESSNSVETEIVKPTPYSMVEEGETNPGFVANE